MLPAATEAVVGVTKIEVSAAGVTVKVAEPLIVPDVAVMVAVPGATAVANPVFFFTVAMEVADEVHVAVLVRFCDVPLLYFPVAVNFWVPPAATEAVMGLMEIEVSVAGVTVNVAEPLIFPDVAVMVAVPWATPLANPVVLFTLATEVADEVHLAVLVRLWVVPLL